MASSCLTDFAAVDRAADPSSLVRYLDEVSAGAGLQQLKRQTYALLALRPGDAVLDVGCGTGADVRAMAELVGPTGRSVGIDNSVHLIEVARERSRAGGIPGDFRVGLAERLEFDDATFDACRAERTLQHVADAAAAVAELIRVLRPGGRLVCFEPDWDLQTFDGPDRALTRAICTFRADRMGSGAIGSQLRRLFLAGDLIDVRVTPMAGVMTDLGMANALMGLRGTVEEAAERGAITHEEAARWWADQEAADRAGRFFAASVAFLVSGRKPAA